ncbi:unnamed protein product [Choristocarpus tenellus]
MADESKLGDVDLDQDFSTAEKASETIKLKAFMTFTDTADAVAASSDMIESKMGKSLKKFLTKNIIKKELTDKLAVLEPKLASSIKDKLSIKCVSNFEVIKLMRGIRSQLESLLSSVGEENLKAMRLGLSHSLSRYKLKFSADKVDTMIIQAIGLLDEMDKEINTYAMRVKEWFGWHFPEMAKIINDNMHYAKCVVRMGTRVMVKNCDFSDILGDEQVEQTLKESAEISMGTEITERDVVSIKCLAEQVVALSEYRIQLSDYLRSRMQAIAPNLTIMVGELVGARLISHAGSLINLAKQPASTVQILGAEKALFRALKTKHDTPKYGLIYHASLIGQATPKNKGKISRVLAAKAALAVRVDALADDTNTSIGIEGRSKVEARLRQMEGGIHIHEAGLKTPTQVKKYDSKIVKLETPVSFNTAEDMVVVKEEKSEKKDKKDKKDKKRKSLGGEGEGEEEEEVKSAKKNKKNKKRKAEEVEGENGDGEGNVVNSEKKKKKKKKIKTEIQED